MEIISKILNILLKQSCLLCRQDADNIVCDYCFKELLNNVCAFKEIVELEQNYDYYYLLKYSTEIKYLLKKFKFNKDLLVAPIFVKLITHWWDSFASKALGNVDAIAVVPIHRYRYLYRGFNQSEIIANGLAEHIGAIETFDFYKRVKYTRSQARSSKQGRMSQIEGVFKLQKPIIAKHLLVFDDVFTTGSTLKEFIRVIKKDSQIEKISVVTLVRAG